MKTAMTNASSLLVAVAIMISMWPIPVVAAPSSVEDVRNVVAEFATDWNRHDMAAFGKLFAPDADFVNVQGHLMVGRKEIQLEHSWSHGTIPENSIPGANPAHYGLFKHSTMMFIHIDVRLLRKDVALAHVNWELLGDSRTQNARRGLLSFVLTRQNGAWLIAGGQNTEINRTVK